MPKLMLLPQFPLLLRLNPTPPLTRALFPEQAARTSIRAVIPRRLVTCLLIRFISTPCR
jgi:hypothetical protein